MKKLFISYNGLMMLLSLCGFMAAIEALFNPEKDLYRIQLAIYLSASCIIKAIESKNENNGN
jgi:hypothetical protein